ncbi:neuraminidase-like domain-containing protein [Nostoc parmelioides]|uniref:PA14 domain-containing protein n=1 Tax=Nostoc parmelioides FACHB-3921 TaxID=2692909 RepID=A0ABR8BMB3_9NOSO|nr:neuraminidase-like domain-containing protein [Nostoc parmelioides]MBD2254377.1 hypothetical protein [Nostoc parmelioides FACHB-3921]
MPPITFPLQIGDKGSEVVNLQNGLLFLLRRGWFQLELQEQQKLETVLLEEQQRQFFSDNATYQLLKRFWERTGVQPQIEGVDQATAEAFNKILRELGAFSNVADEVLPEINKKLDVIIGGTERLGSIDNQLAQHSGQLGKIEGNLSNQNSQLGSINSKLGDQTIQLGSIDSKLGDHTGKLNSIDAKLGNLGDDRGAIKFLTLNDRGSEVKELQAGLTKIKLTIPENELSEQVFGVGTRDALLQLQANYKLERTGMFDDASKVALERAIAALDVPTHRVEGRILFEHGLPADGVTLKLYNRGFGGKEELLREVKTDSQGIYALAYPVNGKAVNLEVRAIDAQGKEVSLSETKRNASKNEVLNLVAPTAVQPLAAEFQRLTRDLSQQLDNLQQLGNAQEDNERQDFTLLHQATGWDARLIALASTAVKLSAETGIPQDALYALFRVGLPTDKDQLAQVSGSVIEQAIAKARESGVVSLTDQQVAGAKAAADSFARQSRRAAIAPGAVSNMGAFLNQSGLADNEKTIFEDLYFAHQGAELWQKAEENGIAPKKVASLQLQGKLAYLTLNNANLTEVLQQELQSPDHLAQLADKDLYQADAWKTRLTTLAGNNEQTLQTLIPPIYAGEKIGDRLDAYAADLARKVRLTYPTQVVSRMIEKDELQLGTQHNQLKAPVRTFLQNAEPLGFELGRTPIAAFIKQNQAVLNGIAPEQVSSTTESIKQLQRQYQITPTDESLKVLMTQGFTSAQDVVAFPYDTFIERFGKFFPSLDEARLVYRKAEQVSAVTFNFFTAAKQLDSSPATHVTSPPAKVRKAAKEELIKYYPTMETLFGSLDFCECEHCLSVLSPAAYFVDLLQFIDPKTLVWQNFLTDWKAKHGTAAYPFKNPTAQTNFLNKWREKHPGQPDPKTEKTPYEVLIERRPDLPNLPLTCENTQTALPYIDIVNEILEYYVANDQLTANSGHDTGSATTPELLAEPQNILAAAYTRLRDAKYPLTLPFDLWLETVRRFFDHFETPLSLVLDVLHPTDELFPPATSSKPYYRSTIWAESLGISPSEYSIFTSFDPMKWYELYGYTIQAEAITVAQDENGQRIDLNSAKALSRRLGLSYKELVELVRTGFVNPQLEKLVVLRKLGVDVDDVFRYKGQAGYPAFTPDEQVAFKAHLDTLTAKFPGFNAETWLDTAWNDGEFNQILLLADPNAGCNFDLTTLRYADGTPADGLVFLKLNLFVRLWRKLGWTIAETDRALQVFVPQTMQPLTSTNIGPAFKTALVYLAHLKEISDRVPLGKETRLKWLTLWSNLSTTGNNPLYVQLFLKPSILKNDPVFDHPLGSYLSNTSVLIKDHLTALQGASNLTAEEIGQILAAVGQDQATASLSLPNVSLLYRYRLLAKALKLNVHDLITLKELSGLDPFKPLKAEGLTILDDDYPFTQTLKYLEIADKVKQSGFKIEDLDYLLRHRFDPVGKYRANLNAVLGLVKTLATEILRIQAEHAIPADAASLTDEVLRQKLALVLPTDVVETFLGMWTGAIEYEATQKNILPANQLDPNSISDPAIRLVYNEVRQEQRLTFRGVLLETKKTQLTTANPSPLLATLLNHVQIQAKTFFDKYLASFLKGSSDFDLLFTSISETLPDADKLIKAREKRDKLVQAFFPFLQSRLIRQLIVQTLATDLSADSALLEALLTNTALLTDPTATGQHLLEAFATTHQQGISALFFPSADGTGTPTTQRISMADTTDRPTGSNSARLEGYFEVPTAGAYRFFVVLDKQNAEAELQFTHLPDPLLRGKASTDSAEISQFTELKPGVPYQFTLNLRNLGDGNATLLIQGETLPKDNLSQLICYPQAAVDRVHRVHTLLTKTLQLIQGFALNEREVRYLLTHATDFGNLNLSLLPTRSADSSPAIAAALFQQVLHLADYTQLKRDLAGDTDDMISLFENARRTYPASLSEDDTKDKHLNSLYERISAMTRRDKLIVQAVAQHLGFTAEATLAGEERRVTAADFAQAQGIERLWEMLQVVEKFGVSIAALVRWTEIVSSTKTNDERFAIARDLRNTINGKYEPETWQQIAKPIFDKLRQRQRDTLVAYILPRKGFDRLEQLFEYFLIDPGMEPVVQTSRIRLAISSVQLFIQRCLLNLEPQVQPTAINSKHWQWMKRYRVWEANRKIFLYPENWLEPEFRDDKTNLFQELESALLQSDISNDLAEDAFFNYLKKLEELARLEIMTMYVEEKPLDPASNTLHVIGRTYSIPHKYFYRRYAHQMWTPWEPVTAQIEGDHIAAVVWRDRLHLFWVTFLEGATSDSSGAGSGGDRNLTDFKFNELISTANQTTQREIKIQLNWSEFFQGKWTTRESGGFGNPVRATVDSSFDKEQVFIHVTKDYDEEGEERGVRINLLRFFLFAGAFRVVSKNGTPEVTDWTDYFDVPYSWSGLQATQLRGNNALQVSFVERIETVNGGQPTPTSTTKPILQQGSAFSLLLPSNPRQLPTTEVSGLVSPFFYQDSQHTFFVEPTLTETTIDRWEEWVVTKPKPVPKYDDDWWQQIPVIPVVPYKPIPIPNPIDPIAKFPINPGRDWVVNPSTMLQVGGTFIGQQGGVNPATLPAIGNISGMNGAISQGRNGANANVRAGDTGELALMNSNLSLNVIDSNGLNSAMLDNISANISANLSANFNANMSDRLMRR